MGIKDDIMEWHRGCVAFDEGDFQTAVSIFEPIADVSKMHFNMSMTFWNLNMPEQAISSMSQAITCDTYLAVAYFQRGYFFYTENMFTEALADFSDAITHLRGNLIIDYTQLGLTHRLHACELHFNRGLAFSRLGHREAAVSDFDDAMRKRVDAERHGRMEMAMMDDMGGCRPFRVERSGIFRPHEEKVRNMRKVDYLGKALVVAATDRGDRSLGFKESKMRTDTISRKASRPGLDAPEEPIVYATPEPSPPTRRASTLGRSISRKSSSPSLFPFLSLSRRQPDAETPPLSDDDPTSPKSTRSTADSACELTPISPTVESPWKVLRRRPSEPMLRKASTGFFGKVEKMEEMKVAGEEEPMFNVKRAVTVGRFSRKSAKVAM